MKFGFGLAGLLLCATTVANADVSDVFPSVSPPSVTHESIIETVYGGDFVANGDDYNDGGSGVSAIRFDDSLTPNGMISLLTAGKGDASDRVWSDAFITAKTVWLRADFTQQFGFDRGNGFELLFDAFGEYENVTGEGSADLTGETWRWVRRDQDGTRAWSSDPGQNPDFLDHMVTYQVDGLNRTGVTYLIFIEDLYGSHTTDGGFSDRDFDDLVIEVHATPEPATAMLVLGGAMIALRRRR
ncbi:MAG: PEP-CTERM sorting domain-containing protein [Phycisphaerae bacterium]|nr:PEP-CTERM sorting domain-containing protein [Phycisphaerales bacterium]